MPRRLAPALVLAAAALPALPAAAAAPAGASETDRLIFADRDWSGAEDGLAWTLERAGPPVPGFMPVTGALRIVAATDAAHGIPVLDLHEVVDGRDRVVGSFPRSVDPLLIYFLEGATRHMAALTGGNPVYIRNRIKEALRRGGAVLDAPDGGRTVILSPFLGDPNADRMQGFQTLTLVISLAPEAGAPIRGLSAEAPAAGYRLQLAAGRP